MLLEKEQTRREHLGLMGKLTFSGLVWYFAGPVIALAEEKLGEKKEPEDISVKFSNTKVHDEHVTTDVFVLAKGIEKRVKQPMEIYYLLCVKKGTKDRCYGRPTTKKYDFSKKIWYKDHVVMRPLDKNAIRRESGIYLKAEYYNEKGDIIVITKKKIKD